LFDT